MFNLDFEYFLPTKIYCKENAIDEVGLLTKALGEKALLITGQKSMERLGYIERVTASLKNEGIEVFNFKGIPVEPKLEDLSKAAKFAKDNQCDFIVALGGGSVIDSSKAVAVGATHPGEIIDYLRSKKYGDKITDAVMPIVAIPSTSGSGSETTCYSVLSNKDEAIKDVISSPHIYPKMCIIDPAIPANAPNSVKISAGLDVLSHAFEGYISKKASPIVAALAVDSIRLVFEYLPRVISDVNDMEAHAQMAVASAMAGIVISEAGTVAGHGTAHAWGGAVPVTHGLAVAALLPWVIEINKVAAEDKLAYLADRLDMTEQSMDKTDKIARLMLEIDNFYKKIGFDIKDLCKYAEDISFEEVATIAMKQPVIQLNPYPVSKKDIEKALQEIASR